MQKLAETCIKRPVFATMLVLALVVLGLDAYRKLGVDLFPKIDFPYVTVTTVLRGASPEEVETQVTKRIEEAVNTISGIDEIISTSAEGFSRVTVAFVLEKDVEVAAQEVRDKINSVLSELPRDAELPLVEKLATDAGAVINVAVSSPRELRETTKIVEDNLKKNLETIAGVGQVRFVGERERQIQVLLDGEKLYSYNLNVEQVRVALAMQNVEVPGGRIDQGPRELSVRTLGRIERPRDFERLVVANLNGSPIRISDIGEVVDGVKEPRSLARLNGRDAVVLEVRKQSGTNTVAVIDAVKARVEELRPSLPADFRISYVGDQSTFIKDSFLAVQEHLILGGFLAAGIVLLFIRSWRSTLIAAIAIPTSIISTYSLMNHMGFTLNQITMLALTLMVGIVIDDAIVVLENIFRFLEEKRLSPVEAAIQGTRDIGLAVLTTTLSLAVVFLPVAMMEGIVGRFMSSFGYTAAFAVMVSLLVSFTLTPMLCSRFLRHGGGNGSDTTKDTWLFRALAVPYRAMLHWSIHHRWVIACVGLLTMFSVIPLFQMIGKDFLPSDDQSAFDVFVRMPAGSSLEGTTRQMEFVEKDLHTLPGVRDVLMLIGSDLRRQVDRGNLRVELVPMGERKQSQREIMLMARQALRKYQDLVITIAPPSMLQGMGTNYDFQFFLQGPDLARLDSYAARIKKKLATVPGVVDLDSTYESGKPEVRVRINRDKASDLGVNVAAIASAVRTLVGGDDQVTTYREGDDRYDVQLRVKPEFRHSAGALSRLFVPSSTLGNVPLNNVTSLQEAEGPINIDRYNRQRQIMVTASIVGGQSLDNVLKAAQDSAAALNMPPEYRGGPVGKTKELGRAAMNYAIAFLLSVVFMYMILASQFESFIDPVTILISLPLSVPFALLSLLLMKENFSIIYSSVGILVLFGIVKKNAILQLDHIKALRREGIPRLDAILRGCEDRLRPILMTTAALVAGMIPLAVGGGAGSGTRRTVAIVVIGGQSLCLLLTLLLTPVAYSVFDDLAHAPARFRRLFNLRYAWDAVRSLFPALLLVALLPSLTWGQPQPPPRIGVGAERPLALREAIEMALKNNLEIEIERTSRSIAAERLKGVFGAYDPVLKWRPAIETRNTPVASVLQGPSGVLTEHSHVQNVGLVQQLPFYGASAKLDFDNARLSSSNPFINLSPFFNTRLAVSFSQPIVRNRTIDPIRAEIKIRRKQQDLSDTQFELKVIEVMLAVETAYWDLVAVRQDVEVEADGVRLAEELLARNQRMIASGVLAPVEIAASRAELERRKDTWYRSIALVTELENRLKLLLAPNRSDVLWSLVLLPTDPTTLAPPEVDDLKAAVLGAIKKRPEIKALAQQLDINDVQKQLARDQTKPVANLFASYYNTGLGGAVRQSSNPFGSVFEDVYRRLNELSVIAGLPLLTPPSFAGSPEFLIGGYGTSLSNLFSGRFQTFQVGIEFDLNLRNRAAESNYAQTLIGERRIKLDQSRFEQGIESQVRNSLQALTSARQRITAAEASIQAANERLDSESRLFQTGESTNFLVLTRQNELLESRRRGVLARLDFNRAITRLLQALGATLDTYNITLQ
jgi:HAE1 family hydrophobic/amphiphilic exporter-1